MSLCDTVCWQPQALRGWSPGKGRHLEHPTSAICPVMALPRLSLPPARCFPNPVPYTQTFRTQAHFRQTYPGVYAFLLRPQRSPSTTTEEFQVYFPTCTLTPASAVLSSSTVNWAITVAFQGLPAGQSHCEALLPGARGPERPLSHLQQLGHPAERPGVCPHRLICQGSFSGSEMRMWQEANTIADTPLPLPHH